MAKKGAILGALGALLFLAGAEPSLAATVQVTDTNLQPATVTINRGEEVGWVDATTDRNAHVALDFSSWRAGIRISRSTEDDVRAKFDEPGTYGYSAHVASEYVFPESGGGPSYMLRGQVVVK